MKKKFVGFQILNRSVIAWDEIMLGMTEDGEVYQRKIERVNPETPVLMLSEWEKVGTCGAQESFIRPDQEKVERSPDWEAARRVLSFLNAKTGKRFKDTQSNRRLVMGRLTEGYGEEDLKSVVAFKVREWGKDPVMKKYLRPATLFNATKFDQYYGELNHQTPDENQHELFPKDKNGNAVF